MTQDYQVHIFDVTDLYTSGASTPQAYANFRGALCDLADDMTQRLPEYYVDADVHGSTIKLVFTRVEPPQEDET